MTIHTIWSSLLSDDDDVLDEDELDDALPGFATFVDGGLSCRTLAEKRMVAIAMEPNQNLLLGVNVASKTFSCVRLTKLLKNHCMKPKKMAKMKPPPSSPWATNLPDHSLELCDLVIAIPAKAFPEYVSVYIYIYINETQDVPGTSGTAFQSQDVGD